MLRLCELTGLTVAELGEIIGFSMAVITVSVFFAIILSWALKLAFELAAELLNVLCDLIRKKIAGKWHRRNR